MSSHIVEKFADIIIKLTVVLRSIVFLKKFEIFIVTCKNLVNSSA